MGEGGGGTGEEERRMRKRGRNKGGKRELVDMMCRQERRRMLWP